MPPLNVRDLGDFIRDQRKTAQISLRQLARQAGVSNPYLSQIERGLRKPSAEILQQIARALRISAEVLYVQAGILDERATDNDVVTAVLADPNLTERQKQVVVEIYDAFRKENAVNGRLPTAPLATGPGMGQDGQHAAERSADIADDDPMQGAAAVNGTPADGAQTQKSAPARKTSGSTRGRSAPKPRTPAARRPRSAVSSTTDGSAGTVAGATPPDEAAAAVDPAVDHDPMQNP